MTQKTALITGITGQDGSYLAEFLLEKSYKVVGMVRRTSTINFDRLKHFQDDVEIVQGDLLDQMSLVDILQDVEPDEVYNLAAQSFVPISWKQPVLTGEFTALGVTRVLDAIRIVNPKIKFYQASSSEMFGKVHEVPQTEKTPFYPAALMGWPKYMDTGSRSTIEKAMISSPAPAFCSTTKALAGESSLSPIK